MNCVQCSADNEAGRKFCKSCGAAIGILCDRCKTVNPYGDKYCGVCGFTLVESRKEEPSTPASLVAQASTGSGQYTAGDIDQLMNLRRKMKMEEDLTESLRQDDIDELFGWKKP